MDSTYFLETRLSDCFLLKSVPYLKSRVSWSTMGYLFEAMKRFFFAKVKQSMWSDSGICTENAFLFYNETSTKKYAENKKAKSGVIPQIVLKNFTVFNPLSANPTKWSNTLCCRRIVWVYLTILWGWHLTG